MILADGLTWQDCRARGGPALARFLSVASVGSANARTADRGEPLLSACATLGAGRRMTAPESAGYGLGLNERFHAETAADIYLRRMGRLPSLGEQGSAGDKLPAMAAICIAWPGAGAGQRRVILQGAARPAGRVAEARWHGLCRNRQFRRPALVCRPAVLGAMDARAAAPWSDVGRALLPAIRVRPSE